VILVGQVLAQEPHRGHAQRPIREQTENPRVAPPGSRGLNPVVGRILREAEHLRAIGEERRESRREVEPARLELGQMHEQSNGRLAFAACKTRQFGDELGVR
jgi:hypothetical protein